MYISTDGCINKWLTDLLTLYAQPIVCLGHWTQRNVLRVARYPVFYGSSRISAPGLVCRIVVHEGMGSPGNSTISTINKILIQLTQNNTINAVNTIISGSAYMYMYHSSSHEPSPSLPPPTNATCIAWKTGYFGSRQWVKSGLRICGSADVVC